MAAERYSAGAKAKSDCLVAYERGDAPLEVAVKSSVGALFGAAIAAAVRRVAAEFGADRGRLEIEDDGALDSAITARTEAALRKAGFARAAPSAIVAGAALTAAAVAAPSAEQATAAVAPAAAGAATAAASREPSPRDRPRRARLYLPGDQPHLAINAGLFGADCLIFDLEDAVAEERKFDARILVRVALERGVMLESSEVAVRVNPLSGPYGADDLAEIVRARPQAIILPKCESAADVAAADSAIGALEEAAGMPHGFVRLMPLVETAAGVLQAAAIAAASPRNVALCFGREDFSRDIRAVPFAPGADLAASAAPPNAAALQGAAMLQSAAAAPAAAPTGFGFAGIPGAESFLARQMIVLAARAAGIDPLDSVFADVEDEAGLIRSCAEARALGFAGKGVIHPVQIPVVLKAFRPTDKEAARAERIVAAFDAAVAEGRGAISVDGAMVDAPVAAKARALLAQHRGEA
ncbi:aldolase/citrate lyase family protein [bacterium]|nr:aldolase/citrate lyase family protein [bacterium]